MNTGNFEKMMQRMLKHFNETVADVRSRLSMEEKGTRLIDKIKKYIHQHYCENLQLSDLSERFNFSVGYLSTLFSRETGMTFKEYITMLWIERAKQEMINSDKCIYEICEQLGYNNLEHFSRIFKKIVRCSPSVYRQRHGEAKSCF